MTVSSSERLAEAKASREEGKLLLREGMGTKLAIAKFYHAMMACLYALFDVRDAGRLTHGDLIARFDDGFVKKGKIDAGILDVLRRTYDLTHECDCDHMPVPTEEDVSAAEQAAEKLIRRATALMAPEGRETMNVKFFAVDPTICAECSLALRRFIGGMDGVESIDVLNGRIAVRFDAATMDEERLSKIVTDSIERLGYRAAA